MKARIQPLGENILIAPQTQERQTQGGILLPETATEEKPQQGVVVAVGNDQDIAVTPKQTVIYKRYAGTEIVVDGQEYIIVSKDDILATIA